MGITLLNHLFVERHSAVADVTPAQKPTVLASTTDELSPNDKIIVTTDSSFQFVFKPVCSVKSKGFFFEVPCPLLRSVNTRYPYPLLLVKLETKIDSNIYRIPIQNSVYLGHSEIVTTLPTRWGHSGHLLFPPIDSLVHYL